jgi:polyisoprenoid-binding protein YceI
MRTTQAAPIAHYSVHPAHSTAQFKVRHMMIANIRAEFTASGKESFDVMGDLTIHGVTKEIKLVVDCVTPEAKDPWGGARRGATAETTIKRKDFGLTWNTALENGGVLVGEEVHAIDVELVRKG